MSQKKPQVGYPTVYDMLNIQDNMISNALIEQVPALSAAGGGGQGYLDQPLVCGGGGGGISTVLN